VNRRPVGYARAVLVDQSWLAVRKSTSSRQYGRDLERFLGRQLGMRCSNSLLQAGWRMEESRFFREWGCRCGKQIGGSENPSVQATLKAVAEGFASYANELEKQLFENDEIVTDGHAIVEDRETPVEEETSFCALLQRDFSVQSPEGVMPDSRPTMQALLLGRLVTPGLAPVASLFLKIQNVARMPFLVLYVAAAVAVMSGWIYLIAKAIIWLIRDLAI
jgi:hypothetical protein